MSNQKKLEEILNSFNCKKNGKNLRSLNKVFDYWLRVCPSSPDDDTDVEPVIEITNFLLNVLPKLKASNIKNLNSFRIDAFGPKKVFEQVLIACMNNSLQNLIEPDKVVELSKMILHWNNLDFFGLEDQPWCERFANTDFSDIQRKTIQALLNQLLTNIEPINDANAVKVNRIYRTVFSIACDLQDIKLTKKVCALTQTLKFNYKESEEFFNKTSGEFRLIVLTKADTKFIRKLAKRYSSNTKIDNNSVDNDLVMQIESMARSISFEQLTSLHGLLHSPKYSDVPLTVRITEFIFALEGGNISIAKAMCEQKLLSFAKEDMETFIHILFVLSDNSPTTDWIQVSEFIYNFIREFYTKDPFLDPIDGIELMCKPFFESNRNLIMSITNWSKPLVPSITRHYAILNDEGLVHFLLEQRIIQNWTKEVNRAKFKIFPRFPTNFNVIKILKNFDLVL